MVYPTSGGHPSTNSAVHSWELNLQPVDRKLNALTTTLPSHPKVNKCIILALLK